MSHNEGHVHFNPGSLATMVNYADQDMEITPGGSEDPIGSLYVKAVGESGAGLFIPTMGWELVPGTSPALEARADAHDPVGYLRIRVV